MIIGGIIAVVIIFEDPLSGDIPSGDTLSDTECETGYVKVDKICEETCALGPCIDQNLFKVK